MRRRAVPRADRRLRWRLSRPVRWVRGIMPDRNPVRRAVDRAEVAIMASLLVAFAVLAPVAASLAEGWASPPSRATAVAGGSGRPLARASAPSAGAGRHLIRAELLTGVPRLGPRVVPLGIRPLAVARWTWPAGVRHTGQVVAPPGSRPGTVVMVWVDSAGHLAAPPAQPVTRDQAAMAGVLVLGAVLAAAAWLAHWLIDRRRMAGWDAQWRAMGPRWSPRPQV